MNILFKIIVFIFILLLILKAFHHSTHSGGFYKYMAKNFEIKYEYINIKNKHDMFLAYHVEDNEDYLFGFMPLYIRHILSNDKNNMITYDDLHVTGGTFMEKIYMLSFNFDVPVHNLGVYFNKNIPRKKIIDRYKNSIIDIKDRFSVKDLCFEKCKKIIGKMNHTNAVIYYHLRGHDFIYVTLDDFTVLFQLYINDTEDKEKLVEIVMSMIDDIEKQYLEKLKKK